MTKPDRLETLYRVSQALGSTLELDPLLEAVMDQVIEVTGAERGFLMLGGDPDSMEFQVARGLDHQTIEAPEFQVSRGVVERVAAGGEPILSGNAETDEWLANRTSVMNLKLRSLMCAPLKVKGEQMGLVYVDSRIHSGVFTDEDLELLQAVASAAGVAIENARLHQLALERARLGRELELARQIQASLIPTEAPSLPGYQIAGMWRSAREVAGDFYDFIPTGNGGLGVVIGDVTDKGVPAALFMALARTSIRASVLAEPSLRRAIERANRLVAQDAESSMFVTLYSLSLKPKDGHLTSVCAGHNPPLHLPVAGEVVELARGSFPLGIQAEAEYDELEMEMDEGDVILLYTDGVVDAINSGRMRFGEEALKSSLQEHSNLPPQQLLRAIGDDIDRHRDGEPPIDDITMVAIKRG